MDINQKIELALKKTEIEAKAKIHHWIINRSKKELKKLSKELKKFNQDLIQSKNE